MTSTAAGNLQEHFFATRDEASEACAKHLEALLAAKLAITGEASLVVTGGSSPAACYTKLASAALNWLQVHVILSDERWVPVDDDNSNEKLIRETLLVQRAVDATLIPMYKSGKSLQARCEELNRELPGLPQPFAATLLGMGEDGHVASLFPDASNLAAGLDENSGVWCMPVDTNASPVSRLSLTMSALMRGEHIVLLFFGDKKRAVYQQAAAGERAYPVSSLVQQTHTPVHVFWAP